ncbi:MAG: hypothetical protein N2235_03105 [Fischerella sp.]|nr:hypothetical protein [Fischerella sp.]
MLIADLFEEKTKKIVVVYPGRFQPFHKGHAAVYKYLTDKFGYDNVFIATSNKVDPPKSPFNFAEKLQMIALTGVNPTRVVQTTDPYRALEITEKYDPKNTVLIFAVSEKDMAEDPRFGRFVKKDGSPTYLQPAPSNLSQAKTFDQHGYILTVPTFDFEVLGNPLRSASEFRRMFAAADSEQKKALVKDLFGNYSDRVFKLMSHKITENSEYVDIWAIQEEEIRQQLLLRPQLFESEVDYQALRKFLADYQTDTPVEGKKYVYTSVYTLLPKAATNIAHFSKPYRLVKLSNSHATFDIDGELKTYPEKGTLAGDLLKTVLMFSTFQEFEKFLITFKLKFGEWPLTVKVIDREIAANELNETLKRVNGRWALVSKSNPKKVLQYYRGSGHPSEEWVKKVERRVHSFESTTQFKIDNIKWDELPESLTLEEKLHLVENLILSFQLNENANQEKEQHFLSLGEMSDTPITGKIYIGTTLYYSNGYVNILNSPTLLTYRDFKNNFHIVAYGGRTVEWPAKSLTGRISIITVFFDSTNKYDQFRTTVRLVYNLELPELKMPRINESLDGLPRIRRVTKELADGTKITTYEVLDSEGVTVKSGLSLELAKEYLSTHRYELMREAKELPPQQLPQNKPRNFVAKNAINTGAGAHKDKKRAAKQGDVKHKGKLFDDTSTSTLSWKRKVHDDHGENIRFWRDRVHNRIIARNLDNNEIVGVYKHDIKQGTVFGPQVKEDAAGVGIITKQNTTKDVGPGTIRKNLKAFKLIPKKGDSKPGKS